MNILPRLGLLATAFVAHTAFAEPQTYNIDPSHTFANFSYSHFGLSTQISKFNRSSGTVVFDKAAQSGEVDILIDMSSVDTGFDSFNTHIQGEDFLDTATHPEARFKSTDVKFADGKPVSIDGELTIKGITKPVTLTVNHFVNMPHPMLQRDSIGANASTTIKRSEFNAGKYAPHVADEVLITVSLEAILED